MNGKYLLDTNIVIALFANEERVMQHIAQADAVFISSITLGELNFGARKSFHAVKNLKRLDEFARSVPIFNCDEITAGFYGEVKESLRLTGHPIPENDIWIAAISLQNNLILATRDAHFQFVNTLRLANW